MYKFEKYRHNAFIEIYNMEVDYYNKNHTIKGFNSRKAAEEVAERYGVAKEDRQGFYEAYCMFWTELMN